MDRWAVDRAVYSTDSASSELVPTVAEKAAHIFVGFSSNRGTAAPGMLSLAVSFKPAGKQVSTSPNMPHAVRYLLFTAGIVSGMKCP